MKEFNGVMTERQLKMCSLLLFAGGYDWEQIGIALGLTRDEAVEYTHRGTDEHRVGLYPQFPANNWDTAKTDPELDDLRKEIGQRETTRGLG